MFKEVAIEITSALNEFIVQDVSNFKNGTYGDTANQGKIVLLASHKTIEKTDCIDYMRGNGLEHVVCHKHMYFGEYSDSSKMSKVLAKQTIHLEQ